MEMESIRKYAEIMKKMELTALEIREDGSIRIERTATATTTLTRGDERPDIQGEISAEAPADQVSVSVITSPVVGMFYIAPLENANPFVSVGSAVKKGDVVCIVEAMKLMNEITAETDGTVIEVLAVNGAVVEYGQPLFRIRSNA